MRWLKRIAIGLGMYVVVMLAVAASLAAFFSSKQAEGAGVCDGAICNDGPVGTAWSGELPRAGWSESYVSGLRGSGKSGRGG